MGGVCRFTKTQTWSAAMRYMRHFKRRWEPWGCATASGFTAIWPRIEQSAHKWPSAWGSNYPKGRRIKTKHPKMGDWFVFLSAWKVNREQRMCVKRDTKGREPSGLMMEQVGVFTPVLLGLTPQSFSSPSYLAESASALTFKDLCSHVGTWRSSPHHTLLR